MLLRMCHSGFWAHPGTNTEQDTTESIFTYFPQMIHWNTPTGLYPIRICKRKHVLSDETNNVTQDVSFWVLSTPRHQHWIGYNWIDFHLFPTNDVLKHPLERIRLESERSSMFFLTNRKVSLTRSHWGLGGHLTTNTEQDRTESIFTCFPQRIAWTTSQIYMRKLNVARGLFSDGAFDGVIQVVQTSFLHRLNCVHFAWTFGELTVITNDGWHTVSCLLFYLCLSVV
jgi:hypothetical protein